MSLVEIWYFLENVKVFPEILAMLHLSDSKFSQMYLKKQLKRALFTLTLFSAQMMIWIMIYKEI